MVAPTDGAPASSLERRRLHQRERVVVERSREDLRVDQAEDVFAGAQVGGIDHVLHPSTRVDDTGSGLVVPTVQISPGEGLALITLVEPGREAAAGMGSAGGELALGSAGAALLRALGRGLLPGLPTHLLFLAPLGRAASGRGSTGTPFSSCFPLRIRPRSTP